MGNHPRTFQVWPTIRSLLCLYHKIETGRREIYSHSGVPMADREKALEDLRAIICYKSADARPSPKTLHHVLRARLEVRLGLRAVVVSGSCRLRVISAHD